MRVLIIILASLIIHSFSIAQNPILLGSITDDANTLLEGAFDMDIVGNYAYVASIGDEYGIEIIDISDPSNPIHVGSLEDSSTGPFANSNSIEVIGNFAYSKDKDGELWIIDVSDVSNPTTANRFTINVAGIPFTIIAVYEYNGFLICESFSDFFQYELSSPTIPNFVDSALKQGSDQNLQQDDLLVSISSQFINVFDLNTFQSNSTVLIPSAFSLQSNSAVFIQNNIAYCFGTVTSSGDEALASYNITNASSPTLISQRAYDLASVGVISGDQLYTVNGNKAQIFDISDPIDIPRSGFLDLPFATPSKVLVEGDVMYVLSREENESGQGALRVLSIDGSGGGNNNNNDNNDNQDLGVIIFDDLVQVKDYVLPSSDGSNGQVIRTNGNGTLSWTTVSSGDPSSTNELQSLNRSGSTATLSNGGGSISINDDDASTTNEIQSLSINGNNLQLSNGGGNVNLSSFLDSNWEQSRDDIFYREGKVLVGTNNPVSDSDVIFQVGESGDGNFAIANSWEKFSDRRYKRDIHSIKSSLSIVKMLEGRRYNWKKSGVGDIGFIAQEVEDVIPDIEYR